MSHASSSGVPRLTITKLRSEAAGCKACDLTQTVFGEGKQTSTVMLIGEQPGDSEDLAASGPYTRTRHHLPRLDRSEESQRTLQVVEHSQVLLPAALSFLISQNRARTLPSPHECFFVRSARSPLPRAKTSTGQRFFSHVIAEGAGTKWPPQYRVTN